MRSLYVFFATGRSNLPCWRHRQLSRLIRVLTCSKLAHCAIGYDGVVLHPAIPGVHYWPLSATIDHYPAVCALVKVPVQYGVNLRYFEPLMGVSMRVWPTLWRWFTFGRAAWAYDCLCITLACLHAGGVNVPRTIATPRELYSWLRKEGYVAVDASNCNNRASFQAACRHLVAAGGVGEDLSGPDA